MFWRRIFDHNPDFVTFSDKIATKDVFRQLTRPIDVPDTLWRGTDPAEFPESLMRDDVVVKHNSGYNQNWFFHARGTDRLEFEAACRQWMSAPFGQHERQWAYSAVDRQIFAEAVISKDPRDLAEIKVQVIDGEVYYAMIYVGEKTEDSKSAIFSETGQRLKVTNSVTPKRPGHALPEDFRVPDCYDVAMEAAREIGAHQDYVRVDFIVADGRLYGGEVTVYPSAGLMTNSDPDVLQDMANHWKLDKTWFVRTKKSGWMEIYRQSLIEHLKRLEDKSLEPQNLATAQVPEI